MVTHAFHNLAEIYIILSSVSTPIYTGVIIRRMMKMVWSTEYWEGVWTERGSLHVNEKKGGSCGGLQMKKPCRLSHSLGLEMSAPYMVGRIPRSLFMGSGSWWMCHDSKIHLGYQYVEESITSAAAQSTRCPACQQCSATADVLVSAFLTALSCSFILQRKDLLDWPMYAFEQSLHGILYTTPFWADPGIRSLGFTNIW